jgi:hypothetical protein
MAASKYDFAIEQGTSFSLSLVYKDQNDVIINLTGYCARLILRTNSGEVKVFSTTETDYSQYKFTIEPLAGRLLLKIPASSTNSYSFLSAKYDLEIQSPVDHYTGGGKSITRILYGTITIVGRNSETSSVLDC